MSATFVLIKGSNTIMRYFGVDVGLKDGFAQMAGAFAIGKTISDVAQKPFNRTRSDNTSERCNPSRENEERSINNTSDELSNRVNLAGNTNRSMKPNLKGMSDVASRGTGEDIIQNGKSINDDIENGVIAGQRKGKSIRETNSTAIDALNQATRGEEIKDRPITPNDEISSISGDMRGYKEPSGNANTKLNQEQEVMHKDIEANGNIKLKTNNDNKFINQEHNGNQVRQEIKPDISTSQQQGVNKDVLQGKGAAISQDSVRRIKEQVDRVNYGNMDQVKQEVIQEVKKDTVGNNEVKQRVIQEIDKSSVATPQQVQQNVQQVLQSARVPQQVNEVVQRVIQDVQPGAKNIADIKAKVVQELEQTSFGTKEPIKQTIIQDIKKGFSATPEQMKQNIKQVIKTTEINTDNKEGVNKKPGYFGSIFGESLEEYDKSSKPRNKSRFDFIKGA